MNLEKINHKLPSWIFSPKQFQYESWPHNRYPDQQCSPWHSVHSHQGIIASIAKEILKWIINHSFISNNADLSNHEINLASKLSSKSFTQSFSHYALLAAATILRNSSAGVLAPPIGEEGNYPERPREQLPPLAPRRHRVATLSGGRRARIQPLLSAPRVFEEFEIAPGA